MWRNQRVGVVIPAFNESAYIAATLQGLPECIDRVYFVDDASVDDTRERVAQVATPRVVRIRHTKNSGVGAAIVTGYQRAMREAMDVVVVMAGDGQMDPRDFEGLLAALRTADYAKGNRFLHGQARRMPLSRRAGSRFLSWLTRLTTGLDVDDCQCGYTALTVACAARLPLAELWPRYGYPNDLLALLAAAGARVTEVPVAPVYRGEASGLHAGHLFLISWRILKRFWDLQPGAPISREPSRHHGRTPGTD